MIFILTPWHENYPWDQIPPNGCPMQSLKAINIDWTDTVPQLGRIFLILLQHIWHRVSDNWLISQSALTNALQSQFRSADKNEAMISTILTSLLHGNLCAWDKEPCDGEIWVFPSAICTNHSPGSKFSLWLMHIPSALTHANSWLFNHILRAHEYSAIYLEQRLVLV